jgi:hypothetical protein
MNTQMWSTYTGARENLHPFRFAFLFSGFIFGFLAYLLLGVGLGSSGRYSLLLGIASGVIFGLLIGTSSYAFNHIFSKRNWVTIIGSIMLGSLAGMAIAWTAYTYAPAPGWEAIRPLPTKAVKILPDARLDYLSGEFFIQAGSGQVYGYACSYGFACSWREITDTSTYSLSASIGFPNQVTGLEVPLDQIVDGQEFTFSRNGVASTYSIVLDSKGELFTRVKVDPGITLDSLLVAFAVIGALCAVVSPILILRDQKKPVRNAEPNR